jgi:amino acid permease
MVGRLIRKVRAVTTHNFLLSIALIVGTVVGAGVLGLPYVFARSGFWPGVFNLIIIGIAVTLMTLYVGELALRTKKKHQLVGFAEKYLGQRWRWVMLVVETLGIYTALIAYLIGIGIALTAIFGTGSPLLFSTLFFILASPVVYMGIKRIGESELWITTAKLVLLLFLTFVLIPQIDFANIATYDLSKIFFPFGIVLFSLLGYTVVPEIEPLLEANKRKMRDAILIAMGIVLAIYFVYTFVFVGVFGIDIAEIAMSSLTDYSLLGSIFVLLTMITPFIALSTVVKEVWIQDMRFDKRLSWFLAAFIPFIIFVYGGLSFITLLEISGTYSGGIMGILTCFAVIAARKKSDMKPEYVVPGGNPPLYFAIIIFVLGIIYQTLSLAGLI